MVFIAFSGETFVSCHIREVDVPDGFTFRILKPYHQEFDEFIDRNRQEIDDFLNSFILDYSSK